MKFKLYLVCALAVFGLLAYNFVSNAQTNGKVLAQASNIEEIGKNLPIPIHEYAKYYALLHSSVGYKVVKEDGIIKLYAVEDGKEWWIQKGVYIKYSNSTYNVTVFFYEPYYVEDYIVFNFNIPRKAYDPTRASNLGYYLKAEMIGNCKIMPDSESPFLGNITFLNPQYAILHEPSPEDIKLAKEIAMSINEIAEEYGLDDTAKFLIAHEFISSLATDKGSLTNNEQDIWIESGKGSVYVLNGPNLERYETRINGILEGLLLVGDYKGYYIYEAITVAEIYILKELGFDVKEFEYTPIQGYSEISPVLRSYIKVNPYLLAVNVTQVDAKVIEEVFAKVPVIIVQTNNGQEKLYLIDPLQNPSCHYIPAPPESKAVVKTV